MYVGFHVIVSDFNQTWIFSTYFRKILKYETLWKAVNGSRIVSCEQTGGQTTQVRTYMMKLTVALLNFSNLPNTSNNTNNN
jgi:hypothetical protein